MGNGIFGASHLIPQAANSLEGIFLVILHGGSDLLAAIAAFSIPVMLVHFVRRRQDTPFRNLFLLFGAFIGICGLGHGLNLWTMWFPQDWMVGIVKGLSALIFAITALKLRAWLPQFLALKSPQELETLNRRLVTEQDVLEQRVQERTAALAAANAHLERLALQARTTASIIQQVRRSLDLNEIFTAATAELRRALLCDRVLVYRFNPDWSGAIVAETVAEGWEPCLDPQGNLTATPWTQTTFKKDRCAVCLQENGDNHLSTHFQATQGVFYQENVDYLSVPDICQSDFHPRYVQLIAALQARAYLTVPIYSGQTLWGLLASYQNDAPRTWEPEEIQMVVQVGSQLGVAIQQGELLHRTRQQTAELQQAKESADQANRAKGDFITSMSHELRTPLNAILGFTQLMGRDDTLSPRHQRYVDIVNTSGEHLLGLINNILEMSKIEAGRLQRCDTDFELGPFLENLQAMLGLRARQKGLSFYLEQAVPLPEWICADQGKLRQILLNLLGNAIKFTSSGHVRLRVQADSPQPSIEAGDDLHYRLYFEVEDTGPGLSKAELQVLFEPFQQTKTGVKSGQGSGLGLFISQRYVQLMGADLAVESTVGQGTTFTLALAVTARSQPQRCRSYNRSSPLLQLTSGQEPYRVLVAEDNHTNRILLREYLTPLGFELQEVENGADAIARWRCWRPHLIWMDMRMPKMDGYEATRRIRALECEQDLEPTVILALTATAFEESREAILAAGCDDMVRKPFLGDDLLATMARYLGSPNSPGAEGILARSTATAPLTLNSSALQTMPSDWLWDLHHAASQCSDTKVKVLAQAMPTDQAPQAQALLHLASVFQFERILAVTTPLLSSPEVPVGG